MSLSLTQNHSRTNRRRRRLAAAAVSAVAVAGFAGVAPAVAATTPSAAASCPTGALAFTSTLSNGTFAIGKSASSSGASGTACGSIISLNGGLGSSISKSNLSFAPSTTKVLILDVPTTVTPTSDMVGPTVLNSDGTIDVSLAGTVDVVTDVLGSKCTLPLSLSLTTGKSGALTGTPLTADATTGLDNGKLVDGDFTVPKIKPSKTCNPLIAALTNGLLGLPLKAGASTISFDLALKLGN